MKPPKGYSTSAQDGRADYSTSFAARYDIAAAAYCLLAQYLCAGQASYAAFRGSGNGRRIPRLFRPSQFSACSSGPADRTGSKAAVGGPARTAINN
jgi:hypothetical protein